MYISCVLEYREYAKTLYDIRAVFNGTIRAYNLMTRVCINI